MRSLAIEWSRTANAIAGLRLIVAYDEILSKGSCEMLNRRFLAFRWCVSVVSWSQKFDGEHNSSHEGIGQDAYNATAVAVNAPTITSVLPKIMFWALAVFH